MSEIKLAHDTNSYDDGVFTFHYDRKGSLFNKESANASKFLKSSTRYTITLDILENTLDGLFELQFGQSNEIAIPVNCYVDAGFVGKKVFSGTSIEDIEGKYVIRPYMTTHSTKGYIKFKLQIEEGNESTDIVTGTSHKTTLLLKEPLRGVEGGKFDKIVEEDGKLKVIRYYKEEVFNGSEAWQIGYGGTTGEMNKFELQIPTSTVIPNSSYRKAYSSHFKWYETGGVPAVGGFRVSYSSNSVGGQMYPLFNISTDIVPLFDMEAWKNWLKENNLTLMYELTAPTEEIIHQSINPYVYENGHLTIDSGEVQAPTVLTVNTNLKGTVEANAKEIELLKTNLESLESFYDNYLLESDYAIAKTGLDIYFDYMVEE